MGGLHHISTLLTSWAMSVNSSVRCHQQQRLRIISCGGIKEAQRQQCVPPKRMKNRILCIDVDSALASC
eukprot:6212104-Pleurochrysis_carterae.AAC.2